MKDKAMTRTIPKIQRKDSKKKTKVVVGEQWWCVQVLARDVAYDLIPFAQRRGLHARLAEALETTLPRASATTIAFHYSKSSHAVEGAEWKRAVKAIQYWEMAAEEAMEGIDHHQVGYPLTEASEMEC